MSFWLFCSIRIFSYLSINLSPFFSFSSRNSVDGYNNYITSYPLFSGLIADKIGYIIMMIAGLFLRGIGFIALEYALISTQFLFLLHLLASGCILRTCRSRYIWLTTSSFEKKFIYIFKP